MNQNTVTVLSAVGTVLALGAFISVEHASIRADIREIRIELTDVGQRVARIEGYLELPTESNQSEK